MRRSSVLSVLVALAGCATPPAREPPKAVAEEAPSTPEPTAVLGQEAPAPLDDPTPAGPDRRPRIGSVKWYTWIWEKPTRGHGRMPIGGIRIGTSVALKSRDPVNGDECKTGKWYALEPHGFVCTDDTTTFDLDDPWFRALASVAPEAGPYPYRYAFSTGAPMYGRVPTEQEQEQCEMTGFGPKHTFTPLGKWSEGHEHLVDKDPKHEIAGTDEMPPFFEGNRAPKGSPWNTGNPKIRVIPAGSGFAYARAFRASGRTWLLTPDLFLVPADRAFAYQETHFHGVELGKGVDLPLAFVRSQGEPRYERRSDGAFVAAAPPFAAKAAIPLTGTEARADGVRYLQTKDDPSAWLAEAPGVSVVAQVEKLHVSIGADERWLEARLLSGTMVAYEGKRPRFATLWSGGKGGVPTAGRDPKRYATTELGVFSLQWKDKVATMSPDPGAPTVFWFADVPNIQYVKAPLAMHVAYWHDRYGYLMSAECLNISPEDGAWLFDFTLPRLPADWSAVRPSPSNGPSTRVHIKAE